MRVYKYKAIVQRIRPTDRYMRLILRRESHGWVIVRRELV